MKQVLYNLMKIEGRIESNTDIHNHIIDIAKNNIHELNKRWNNTNEVIYVCEKLKFEPSDYTDAANYNVVDLLNKFIKWDMSEGKDRNYQIQNFLRSVTNKFEELNTELHYRAITNGLNEEDRILIQIFIQNYCSFSPSGFLSSSEKNQIKSLLSQYCEHLQESFLSDIDKSMELSLESFQSEKEIVINDQDRKISINSDVNVNQFFSKYTSRKTNASPIWMRLIGQ